MRYSRVHCSVNPATPTHFRVWAPRARRIELLLEDSGERIELIRESDGGFSVQVPGVGAGTLYRYFIDGEGPYPDPASRFQPDGPLGPSMVVNPSAHQWKDDGWPGIRIAGQVIYEIHIGAFTPEGTFDAALRQLPHLKSLGVTLLEILPVAEFPGRWNWGYDGVDLFAPFHGYGDYDAFKRFVDAAHGHGIAVILDVVYNHVGPVGNYLKCFSPHYFSACHENDWGEALNFDGPECAAVRDFYLANARYWVSEFHLDGLRLDATQSIQDRSSPHIITEIVQHAREAAQPRSIVIIAENEPQHSEMLLPPEQGGMGIDAMWNDDFHHSARVALTGKREGYFHDHSGHAQEFISAAKRGFLFQGQHYHWQKGTRGTSVTHQAAGGFVTYLQNHDQTANTFYGLRLHNLTSPSRLRAITALLLLGPNTPMLFMGQEFSASALFPFFADHEGELATEARAGRRHFLTQFSNYATSAAQAQILDPAAADTFARAKLDFTEREKHAPMLRLHTDLLRIRREDPVIAAQNRNSLDGAVLSDRAFVLRWFDDAHGDRLLLVNLGDELSPHPGPEPLLAPPRGKPWRGVWSSDDPIYGGFGATYPTSDTASRLPGECAVLLVADSS